jgi:DNA-binding transcriptional MerR regulator
VALKNGDGNLRSGQLAQATGVSADTLRHYERRGLLAKPKRLASGYRSYPSSAIARVLLIQNGLAVGFSLDELCIVLGERDAGRAPCGKVRAAVAARIEEVDRRIEELIRFRDDLQKTIAGWDQRLAARAGNEPLRLLETLDAADRTAAGIVSSARFSRRPDRRRRTT